VFSLVALVSQGLSVAQAVQEDGARHCLQLVTTWNTVVVALYTLAIVKACAFDVPRREFSHPPTAEQRASLISYILFNWFTPVITIGLKRRVGADDLPPLIEEDTSVGVWRSFQPYLKPFERHIASLLIATRGKATFSPDHQPSSLPTNDEAELTQSLLDKEEKDAKEGDEKKKKEKKRCVFGHEIHQIKILVGSILTTNSVSPPCC